MQLLVAHQVLIVAAMGLAAIFTLRSVLLFARGGGLTELVLGIVAAAIGGGLFVYLRGVRARYLALKASRTAAGR